jgi:hypothetical protein
MFEVPEPITDALPEQIGDYELFVQQKKKFDYFLEDWYHFLINNKALILAIVVYCFFRGVSSGFIKTGKIRRWLYEKSFFRFSSCFTWYDVLLFKFYSC